MINQELNAMEDKLKKAISRKMKEIRNARRLSQENVRAQTCIDVSCYESAKRLPKLDTLYDLARFYDVKITEFLEEIR